MEKGNGAYRAGAEIPGWTHIAAVKARDDPTTAVGYAIADNRTAERSHWDNERLTRYLRSLPPETPTGFSAAELAEQWETAVGQLWHFPARSGRGGHTLLIGDVTDTAAAHRLLACAGGAPITAGVSDPPYGVAYDPRWRANAGVNEATGMITPVAGGDDLHDEENSRAAHQRELVHNWLHRSFLSRRMSGVGRAIVIGAAWRHDDTYARMRGDGSWVVCHVPLLSPETAVYANIFYPGLIDNPSRNQRPGSLRRCPG